MTESVTVGPLEDLAAGTRRLVEWKGLEVLVANCGGRLHAIENRCSHDDGPLNEGELDESACTVECPRHGSVFDLRSGRPLCPPAYEPVDVFAVRVEDGEIVVEVE
jgi:3-phenylpropionate/trans-cinnamate dioxygenase ferredoxin component